VAPALRLAAQADPRRLEAIHAWHHDVHRHDFAMQRRRLFDCVFAASRPAERARNEDPEVAGSQDRRNRRRRQKHHGLGNDPRSPPDGRQVLTQARVLRGVKSSRIRHCFPPCGSLLVPGKPSPVIRRRGSKVNVSG